MHQRNAARVLPVPVGARISEIAARDRGPAEDLRARGAGEDGGEPVADGGVKEIERVRGRMRISRRGRLRWPWKRLEALFWGCVWARLDRFADDCYLDASRGRIYSISEISKHFICLTTGRREARRRRESSNLAPAYVIRRYPSFLRFTSKPVSHIRFIFAYTQYPWKSRPNLRFSRMRRNMTLRARAVERYERRRRAGSGIRRGWGFATAIRRTGGAFRC